MPAAGFEGQRMKHKHKNTEDIPKCFAQKV